MKDKQNKLKLMIVKSVLPIILGAVVLFASLIIQAGNVFGWFSSNKNVSASGMQVNPHVDLCSLEIAYGEYDGVNWTYTEWMELNDSTVVNMTDLDIPNTVTRFKVRINNISESGSVNFTEFGFQDYTDADETPRVIEGTKYYLGTQISIGVIGEEKKFVSTYQDGTDILENRDKLIIFEGSEEISYGESFELEIEMLFNETDTDQSNYADFGSGSECSKRKLYFIF